MAYQNYLDLNKMKKGAVLLKGTKDIFQLFDLPLVVQNPQLKH